jgi:hypothetical protein
MAEVNFIDGQALDPTSFGEFKSGIWIAKDTSGLTFGTNGFRLEYADSAAIGDDTSGNTNDWTVNNLVASDVVLDSPTNNFAVLNNLDKTSTAITLSEGNLKYSQGATGNFYFCGLTFNIPQSGKWYAEARVEATVVAGTGGMCFGYSLAGAYNYPNTGFGNTENSTFVYQTNNASSSTIRINSTIGSGSQNIAGGTAGDIVQFAFDADTGKCWFGSNGTWYGGNTGVPTAITLANLEAGSSPIDTFTAAQIKQGVTIMLGLSDQNNTNGWRFNAGQDSTFQGATTAGGNADENGYGDFQYAPPSGYLSLCSANLPTGAIDTLNDETPEDYFKTVLYSGNGSTNAITGVGFQPNFTWFKSRSGTTSHHIADVIRGTYTLIPNSTVQEFDRSADGFTSLDSDGFTLNGGGGGGGFNVSGQTFVSWNWKAGGAGVSNTDGSITSTVSVGATSQQNWFSVATYTGTGSLSTVGHGLGGTVPDMVIIKNRSGSPVPNWVIGNSASGWTGQLYFDTGAFGTNSGSFNNTAPTSSVVTINTDSTVNYNTGTYVMYSFANAEGLCKVGSYTGNGSADGTFVYTGFRPAFVMVKSYTAGEHWNIPVFTSSTNGTVNTLSPNLSNAERTMNQNPAVDFVSNGFKIKTSDANYNSNGGGYIFLAIAEQPFKYANAR